jgi:hypothetical protein
MSTFKKAIEDIKINPSNGQSISLIEEWNKGMRAKNPSLSCLEMAGIFPIKYFVYQYKEAHKLRKKYETADDKRKKDLKKDMANQLELIREFCKDKGFPEL